MEEHDPPVLVVDLRRAAQEDDRAALAQGGAAPLPADEPIGAHEVVRLLAVLHDASEEPLLLPLPPSADRRWLDAVARLLRFAVLRGATMPEVAITHGSEYERRLAFERALPAWAYEGIEPRLARALPAELRRVLERRARR
jgi:hypothetical protein